MEPFVSVVIPTYRRPLLLEKCLRALRQQSLSADRYEVIVVSDGPDEATKAAIDSLCLQPMQVRFVSLEAKKGPAGARNAGWQHARAGLIAFTDDDCIPDRGWLSSILSACGQEKLAAFSGKVIVPVPDQPTDFERNTQGLETAAFITANCACTKAALQQIGGFDEQFTMAWREDSDLEFKLLLQGIPVQKLETAIVIHPVRQAPWGVSLREQKKGMFNALLYKKYPALYREKIQPRPAVNYYVMIGCVLMAGAGILAGLPWLSAAALLVWLLLTVQFISRRLANTSHSRSHVMEMIITSLAIPFLSVYWQLYGAFKYKVLFI